MSVSRHTGYNLLGLLAPLALSLITVPIYLQMVGADRYGVLAIAWLLLGYFGLFDLGLGRATTFRIASLKDASPEERANTFWAALAVNTVMGLVGGGVLWVGATLFFGSVFKVDAALRPEILAAMPLLAATVPVATTNAVLIGAAQGRQRFVDVNIVGVMSTALFQLLPLAVAWKFGPNLSYLLAAALFSRSVGALALWYRCHVELSRGHPVRVRRYDVMALLKFGHWVNLTSIISPMLVMVDRFAIGAVMGAAAVTTYTVPSQLASRTAILSYALTQALFPKLTAASPEEQKRLYHRAVLSFAALLGLPFLGAIYLIGPFLQVWVSQHLGPEAPLIGAILVAATWANGLALISFTKLEASGRPDIVTKTLAFELPLYFGLLYLGMHTYGLIGAALATALRLVLDCVLLTLFARPPVKAWIAIAANMALLSVGVAASARWTIVEWQWWASAVSLGLLAIGLGALILPVDVRNQLWGMAKPYLARVVNGRARRGA